MNKIYNLTIMYNEETEEIEFIQEVIEGEVLLSPVIEVPPSKDEPIIDDIKTALMSVLFTEDGGIGVT
jgi:hypothetical protein